MKASIKNTLLVISTGVALLIVFFLGRLTVGNQVEGTFDSGPAAVVTTDAAGNETIWTCSMHPQVRQPEPGQCPICGMDLIPRTSDEEHSEDDDMPRLRLRVSERSAALMNIQTWPAERRQVEREVRLLGRVNYDETRLRAVTAWFPGRLDKLFINIEGATIETGDPVAEIYSPALISAQEELLQAMSASGARGGNDSPLLEAARERLRLLGLDSGQIREIEDQGSVRDSIVIHSPLDGVITERIAVEGTYVEAGDRIAALASLDRVSVEFEAYERDLPWLVQGQAVRFNVDAFAGESFEGRIEQINPLIDRDKRTARVRVLIDNADGILKPGMFARGIVASQLGGEEGLPEWREELPLVIPATAALLTGRRAVVYVKLPDTDRPTFELREVTLGPRAGDMFIVQDGVGEGELVVVNGNFKIDSELQLRGLPSMMAPEGGAAPAGHNHGAMDDSARRGLMEAPEKSEFADDIDPEFAAEIGPLLAAYLEVAEGLSSDDQAAARVGLKKLNDRLLEIGRDRFSGDAGMSWSKHYERLEVIIPEMAGQSGIEGVRSHLQGLTDEMEIVYVDFGRGTLPNLQRAYCPMALNDRGATWLQTRQNIYNPYFGAAMLRCGEILPWDEEE